MSTKSTKDNRDCTCENGMIIMPVGRYDEPCPKCNPTHKCPAPNTDGKCACKPEVQETV